MKSILKTAVLVLGITLAATAAEAATITFEGFAPVGSVVNINPGTPYTEAGFTLTPTNSASAVFDSAAPNAMLGNVSDWFGFADGNIPELTLTAGGSAFDFTSVLIGPSTIAVTSPIGMTIVGNLFGGGTISQSFSNLTTATLAVLNWTNLESVQFRTTDDAGLDNLVVTSVPEPATLVLLASGLGALALRRRR